MPDLNFRGVKKSELPTGGTMFSALLIGVEAYATLRNGDGVTLKCDDGDVEAVLTQAVNIGPLVQMAMTTPAHHYSNFRASDPRNIVDAVERMNPGNPKACDARTIYSQVVLLSAASAEPALP